MRGRIRTIKPDIGKHEELWDLGQETGLPVYQAFTLLWCYADREGRFVWRPRSLKTDILPYWDGDFSRVLDALATRGFLVKYTCAGVEYGVICSFLKHQVINHREAPSDLPSPDGNSVIPVVSTRAPRVDDACPEAPGRAHGEGKGREGNGSDASTTLASKPPKEPKPPKPKPERFVPDAWQPNDGHAAKAAELGVILRIELQKFRAHEFKVPKQDFDRAFTRWLLNASQFATSSGARSVQENQGGYDPNVHRELTFNRSAAR